MYGLPFDGESTGLFYRKDLFEAAGITGPPKTWEEFKAAAEKLTDPAKKQYGFQVFAPEAEYYWYPWLWQNGGKLVTEPDEKTIEFNNDAGKQAADYYVGLVKYSSAGLSQLQLLRRPGRLRPGSDRACTWPVPGSPAP